MKYNDPDWNMLANLDKNVYQFAAAKNYQQLKDITLAVKDGDQIRSFKEFRDIANKISFQYNETWLKTEYNQAIAGGQMAGRWTDFESNKESMPNLQYITAGDDRVREEHAMLDGVVKPVDDPFWDTYYPPNDWGCRCDVMQLPGEDIPDNAIDIPEDKYPPINPLFKTNLAKDGLVFSEKHSYWNIPEDYRPKVEAEAKLIQRIDEWNKVDTKVYTKEYFNTQNGGTFICAKNHKFDKTLVPGNDFTRGKYEKDCSLILARRGNSVKILSGNKMGFGVKNPEGILNDLVFDIKAVEGKTINTIIRKYEQAERQYVQHLVIYFPESNLYSMKKCKSALNYFSKDTDYVFKKVWAVVKNEVHIIK